MWCSTSTTRNTRFRARRLTTLAIASLALLGGDLLSATRAQATEVPLRLADRRTSDLPKTWLVCRWVDAPGSGLSADQPRLLGDLGGLRPSAGAKGIDGFVESTQFYQGVAAGGLQQAFQFGGRNDYFINIDGAKAGLLPGSFLAIHGETRYGESISALDGALIPTSLPMDLPGVGETINALTGFKYTQALSENLVVFAGKMNTIDGFQLNYSGGRGVDRFQNAALVFNTIASRTVPYSTIGAGTAVLRDGLPVASLTVLDAVDRSRVSGVDDLFSNGAVVIGEVRRHVRWGDRQGQRVLGGIWSSRAYTALADTPLLLLPPELGLVPGKQSGSWALYANADQTLWIDPSNPSRSLGLFGMAGFADRETNPIHWSLAGGLGGQGWLNRRPQDEWGAGYYYLGGSPVLQNAAAPFVPLRDEQGLEIYYKINATRWMAITPNLQWLQPIRSRLDDVVVVGVRAKVTF